VKANAKRKRGRPPGTAKLPTACLLDVLRIVDEMRARNGLSISAACRYICKNGGLKWVDSYLKTVAKINDPDSLRARYYDAQRSHRLDERQRRLVRTMTVISYRTARAPGEPPAPGRAKKRIERRDRFVFMPP
jgi:hypothetical protein